MLFVLAEVDEPHATAATILRSHGAKGFLFFGLNRTSDWKGFSVLFCTTLFPLKEDQHVESL